MTRRDADTFRKDALLPQIEQIQQEVIASGGEVEAYYAHLLQAWLPVEALDQIADLPIVRRDSYADTALGWAYPGSPCARHE